MPTETLSVDMKPQSTEPGEGMSQKALKFSLVVPTFNERENIPELLQLLYANLGESTFEIIIVDDDSPDRTWELADQLRHQYPGLRVIRRQDEKGLSSAVLKGFEAAEGEFLGVIDADLSHDIRILPELINACAKGADIAVGSRRVPGGGATAWPWHRRMMSSVATMISKVVLGATLSDPMSGYFVVRRPLYESCQHRLAPMGYKILLELFCKGKPRNVKEVPYVFRDRKQGYSKLSGSVIKQYLQMILMLKSDRMIQNIRKSYHTGRYRKVQARLNAGSVLDLGCGQPCETMPDGAFLQFLGRGTGLDLKPCKGNFDFVQGDVTSLPFEDKRFDNVVAMEILEHVPDSDKVLSEINRVLKDGGTFVMSVPNETWLWEKIWAMWEKTFGHMWHETHTGKMYINDWKKLLKKHFEYVSFRRHWHFDAIFTLKKKPSV